MNIKDETPKEDIIKYFCNQHAISPQTLIDVYEDYIKNAVDEVQKTKEVKPDLEVIIERLEAAKAMMVHYKKENDKLRKLIHEHNNMCQGKLNEQMKVLLPEIKALKDKIKDLESKLSNTSTESLPEPFLIQIIREQIEDAKKAGKPLNSISWGTQEGVLLSVNQAEQILKIINVEILK